MDAPRGMPAPYPATFMNAFADLAHTLAGDFDLAEVLDQIVGHCVTVCGAAGVGLVVEDDRQVMRDIAYSDNQVRLLERAQVTAGEGPCFDCARTGTPVLVEDLTATRARWPRFTPAALDAGYTGVRALPLRHHQTTLGALNLFDRPPGPGPRAEQTVHAAQAFADLAVLAIVQHPLTADRAAASIARALAQRSTIECAKGMLAEDADTTPARALALLRAHAAHTGYGTSAVANALVCGQITTAQLLAPTKAAPG